MVTFAGFRCDLEWAITNKASVIRKLTELMKRVDGHSENFNKELGNRKKSPSERSLDLPVEWPLRTFLVCYICKLWQLKFQNMLNTHF